MKSQPRKNRAPLQAAVANRPLEKIAMDILGTLPETECINKYVLVIGDYFIKWTKVLPMKDMETATVAKILVQDFICRYNTPEQIHTNQGRNF